MNLPVAARIARRELRGGLAGFRIFLLCLTLGVMAIAAVGTVRGAIEGGLAREGASILGGDAEMEFTFRYASTEERAWMLENADAVSELVDFRSMAVVTRGTETERGLTQLKAVDEAYPLLGSVVLDPVMPLAQALDGSDDLPGAVMQKVLIDRLGLNIGDTFALGLQDFVLSAELVTEPDGAGAGFGLGPRTIVRTTDLANAGLLEPGSLFETDYRLLLPEGSDLEALKTEAESRFRDTGMRWRDSRNGAPGVQRFVERIGSFLVLVGLAGLAVGGVGISASVRAYLGGKTATIATLRTLGADRGTVFAVYLLQVGLLTLIGIAAGVVLGAILPLLFAPIIAANLPVPVDFGLQIRPLAEAALYGLLTAMIFVLWPLARTEEIRPATLFRDGTIGAGLPRLRYLVLTVVLVALLVGAAALLSEVPSLAIWSAVGILASLLVLAAAAWGMRRLARWLAGRKFVRGRPVLRTALAAIASPREEAASVVLSLGLGLTVLAAVGQIDSNLRAAIQGDLPDVAPSYFFVDIQSDQLPGFMERLDSDAQVNNVESAPILRGVLTRINGRPAREVAGNHWVVRGDRGITYAAAPPPGTEVTRGEWWAEDYTGPPQVSFAEEEALEIGLELGDMITVNVLGREIDAEITSFRRVDFSDAGLGFVMTLNEAALAGAPHTHIATVYAEEEAEAAILRDLAGQFPNITAVRVRDAIDNVARILASLATATSYGAAATLLTGFVVLIGAAAAGERARVYEAAVLKTVGATRGRILSSFALRSGLMGAAAGVVALFAGSIAGWAVMTFVMEAGFSLNVPSALIIILGGITATLLAGLAFVWRPLSARLAQVLRARD